MRSIFVLSFLCMLLGSRPASALDGPWISTVYFYWYTWDSDEKLGSWVGGIHNTPLAGYYDSRTFADNRRSLWEASEWGVTHHFMDYWAPNWKGEDGQMREAVVMKAAESLRKSGYDIWMSYYQDGENFEMREFSRNVSERRDVHQWLRDFSKSEVWPKIDRRPLQLVYARNGRPETTIDDEGFRRFLKERYGNVTALNDIWRTDFKSFDDVKMTFAARGHQRAESIEYQYAIWDREWRKLDGLVEDEFGHPGMRASFDVGYGPYMRFGYANFARTFGGPHSYAGIFGPPDDQDAERFIQAAVAKKYNTVFLDHFKNYYFDWDIRVPGTAYLPDPYNFDRFWTGALARYSEAILHLSWNEWWEGSNLEPCQEFGKTYCEKNLLYATVMKLAFDSIRTAGQGAPVAVLLNDWRFASGGGYEEELYETIQVLRRLNVPFDLVPDDFATAEYLGKFKLVIAPTYDAGLGYNKQREPILDVLVEWLETGDRRLIVSAHDTVAARLGLREVTSPPVSSDVRGDDVNVSIDVGAEGDDEWLIAGYSGREHWGGPEADRTNAGVRQTFRWTPAVGSETSFMLPAGPNRDHVLRIGGRAIWPNTISVVINGRTVAGVDIADTVDMEVNVPAAVIGAAPMVKLHLVHSKQNIPGEIAPQQYKSEGRVCNLALESVQWSTANVPKDSQEQKFQIVEDSLLLKGETFAGVSDKSISTSFRVRPRVTGPGAEVQSVLKINNFPRDISLPLGRSKVLYVNGPLSEVNTEEYWLTLIRDWAGVSFHRFAAGDHCIASRLSAGNTDFVVCFNQDISQARGLSLDLTESGPPLSEATALSRDGHDYQPIDMSLTAGGRIVHGADTLQYYGVYQFAFSPVKIDTPELVVQPGQESTVAVRVTNLAAGPEKGRIEIGSILPTITGQAVEVELKAGETKTVNIPIKVAKTADWGRKTVYFTLDFGGDKAYVLRELVVRKPIQVELADVIIDAADPRVELGVPENPYGRTAPLTGAKASLAGHMVDVPEVLEGQSAGLRFPAIEGEAVSQPELEAATFTIRPGGPVPGEPMEREVFVARRPVSFEHPDDAAAAVVVFNARPSALKNGLLTASAHVGGAPFSVRGHDGTPVAAQADAAGRLTFLADVPARSARTYYLCRSKADVDTDLRVSARDLDSGRGTLSVENSHLSVTLSEAAGGTVTSLRSLKTNRDYGLSSLGVNYGTFSRHDPASPRTDTVKYINESKTRQSDGPAKIELVSNGPAVVVARVRWADDGVEVEQTYSFPAHSPYFVLRQQVRPVNLANVQELVALDARFQPHRLAKTYPTFTGTPTDKEQPHFGWRRGSWVPPVVSLITPGDFEEAISLLITRSDGLVGVRQGFWPAERPKPGKREVAQIELLAGTAGGCDAEIHVLVHGGHQIVAQRFLQDLQTPPRVDVVEIDK